jgi:hypothetical protein
LLAQPAACRKETKEEGTEKYLHVKRFLAVVQPSAITQSAAAAQSLYNQQTERSLTRVNAPIDPRKFYIRIKYV